MSLDKKAFAAGFWKGFYAPAMLFGARPSWREVALAHQVEPVLGGPEDDFAMMERDFSVAMGQYAAAH
jgi:hypothetical protein